MKYSNSSQRPHAPISSECETHATHKYRLIVTIAMLEIMSRYIEHDIITIVPKVFLVNVSMYRDGRKSTSLFCGTRGSCRRLPKT